MAYPKLGMQGFTAEHELRVFLEAIVGPGMAATTTDVEEAQLHAAAAAIGITSPNRVNEVAMVVELDPEAFMPLDTLSTAGMTASEVSDQVQSLALGGLKALSTAQSVALVPLGLMGDPPFPLGGVQSLVLQLVLQTALGFASSLLQGDKEFSVYIGKTYYGKMPAAAVVDWMATMGRNQRNKMRFRTDRMPTNNRSKVYKDPAHKENPDHWYDFLPWDGLFPFFS